MNHIPRLPAGMHPSQSTGIPRKGWQSAGLPRPGGTDLIVRARVFATAAHGAIGQTRSYTGEPYINHPARVVQQLRHIPHTDEMLAAAWLHDVVEDTAVTIEDIEDEFGPSVARLVDGLTDKYLPEVGTNREFRKLLEADRLSRCNALVQTIKMADIIDNTKDIRFFPSDFAKTYLREKIKLVPMLTGADSTLSSKAWDQISAATYALYEEHDPPNAALKKLMNTPSPWDDDVQ